MFHFSAIANPTWVPQGMQTQTSFGDQKVVFFHQVIIASDNVGRWKFTVVYMQLVCFISQSYPFIHQLVLGTKLFEIW